MDVDRMISQRVDKQNNQESWLAFNRAQGARMSAMEHLVPEQMFSTEEAPANGISAVKAIQLAAAEGQKIYTITQQNLSIALQQIQLSSEIKADIRNAVSAGMEVTTHQQPVNFFGNQSVGYILLDPNTGAGAYRIGGGENGAGLIFIGFSAILIMMIGAIAFGWVAAIIGIIFGVYKISKFSEKLEEIAWIEDEDRRVAELNEEVFGLMVGAMLAFFASYEYLQAVSKLDKAVIAIYRTLGTILTAILGQL